MSEGNVELAKRLYPGTFDLVALLDQPEAVEAFRPLLDPRFETVGAALAMNAAGEAIEEDSARRVVFGVEGFREGWVGFLAAWESWVVTPTEFINVDDERVLVMLDISARSKTHGVEVPIDGANLVTIRGGKVLRIELLSTRAEAREAAGLSE